MNKILQTVAVIPAYKPTDRLVSLCREIISTGYSVIAVDDGSGPEYQEVFDKINSMNGVTVLTHNQNQGKGAALKTAFLYIKTSAPDINHIVTLDADGQHLVTDMENVLKASWDHPDDLILGSRVFTGDVPFKSRMGNKITRSIYRMVSGISISDTQTGLRAFGRSHLDQMITIEGKRYEYEMNVLLSIRDLGMNIREVPIETIYLDQNNSSSHFHPVRDALRIYGHIIKFAGASFVSFLADYVLFILFLGLTSGWAYGLTIANVAARVISAVLNYTLNLKTVFKDQQPVSKTLPKYIALAIFILAANSLILAFYANVLGITPKVAKIMTEVTLFIISFTVQSTLIFKDRGSKAQLCRKEFEI